MKHAPVDISRITRLGRQIDLRLRSNQIAVGGAALAAGIAGAVAFVSGASVPAWIVAAGGSVFLGWAAAREIDPDHAGSAVLAMALAASALLLGPPSLLLVVGILMALRMISGTVGGSLTLIDEIGMVVLAGLVATRPGGVVVVVAMVVAMLVTQRARPRSFVVVAAMAVAAGLGAAAFRPTEVVSGGNAALLLLVPVAGFGLASLRLRNVAAITDVGQEPVSATRVRLARAVATASVMVIPLAIGSAGVAALAPVSAAILAVGVWAYVPSQSPDRVRSDAQPGEEPSLVH